jgi:hypothetical protein
MFDALRKRVTALQHGLLQIETSLLAQLTPSCRVLTAGERAIAKVVFGDALVVDEIRLCSSPLILRHYAMSPNGSVYFHPDDFIADFSLAPLNTQAWLVHELTHVWQVQQGIKVFKKALFDRRYRYVLQSGKGFVQYGVEQQARMVEDWYIKQARGEPCADLQACIPFTTR